MLELTNKTLTELLDAINASDIASLHIKTAEYELSISCGEDDGSGLRVESMPSSPTPVAARSEETARSEKVVRSEDAEPATTRAAGAAGDQADGEAATDDATVVVVAPMLGTFFVASEPGAPPFVQVGDAVTPESTVGLVEAMKVFTAVQSGQHGVVREVLVENGQFVEYGQPLIVLAPVAAK